MKSLSFSIALLAAIAFCLCAGYAQSARTDQSVAPNGTPASQSAGATLPKDIFPETGNRLPGIKRDSLDDAGKKLFDSRGAVDMFGPGAIRLYSPPVAEYMGGVNDYLRHKSGIDPRLVELAILVTARECGGAYEWTAHEPQGLKAGLQPEVIDVVRYRKPVKGLAEKDAVVIELGREAIGKHHVSSDVAARALGLFGKQGLVNIVSLMGDYAATCILTNTFDQHVRPADKSLLPMP
jgi:4-carboxymuconolactone decarboxylase